MRGSPLYSGKTITSDKNKGIKVMKEALAEVEAVISKLRGNYKVKTEVYMINTIASSDWR